MAAKRLSCLQRRILTWLAQEAQRTRGTVAASHPDLVRALGTDKSNLSHSLANLEDQGLVTIARTPAARRRPWRSPRVAINLCINLKLCSRDRRSAGAI